MRIIISRTDSIGDVVLTLPMAGILKKTFPGCTIIFLGREYTRPVIEACEHVDQFVSWPPPMPYPQGKQPSPQPSPKQGKTAPTPTLPLQEEGGVSLLANLHADIIIHVFPVKEVCRAAKLAGIPVRIATAGRSFTWFTCNRRLYIPRKNSDLHEAQLNLRLLKPLGIEREFTLGEIAGYYGLKGGQADRRTSGQADKRTGRQADDIRTSDFGHRTSIILHPKSKGSAREWGLENFSKLIDLLPGEKYNILVTGTKEEGDMMHDFLLKHRDRIVDMTGKLSLTELISLISKCNGLVAASTGPLHLAAALGIRAVGIYAPMRPIFPKRWAPIGKNASFLVLDKSCSDCRKSMDCSCIRKIKPEDVVEKLTR